MPETTSTPTSPDTVTIRRAGPEDAELVQTMVMEIAAHEGDVEHVQVTADHWREQLADPQVIVFVAARDGQPAGYVSAVRRRNLWGGDWLVGVDDLYVREQHRSQRVGEQLMGRMASHAESERAIVRWEMKIDNTGAQRFYARLGASLRTKMIAAWVPEAYASHAEAARRRDA